MPAALRDGDHTAHSQGAPAGPLPRLKVSHLIVVLLLALSLRVLYAERTPLIGADSFRFLAAAELFEHGEAYAAMHDSYHPLAAYMISAVNRVQQEVVGRAKTLNGQQRQRERAAFLVTIPFGLLVVLLLMDLSRRVFPQVPPIVVGLLGAFHPDFIRSSGDIMSDTIFLTLFLLALREAADASRDRRLLTAVSAGGAAGLAYLARPEGLVLPLGITIYWLVRHSWELRFALGRAGVFAATLFVLAAPYIFTISTISGDLSLTLKKDVPAILGLETGYLPLPQVSGGVLHAGFGDLSQLLAVGEVFWVWFMTSPEVLASAALLSIPFITVRREWRREHLLLILPALIMVLVLVRLVSAMGLDYVSRRHVFTIAALALPFAARGLMGLAHLGERVLRPRLAAYSGVVAVLLPLVVMSPRALAATRWDQLGQREAAEYIMSRHGSGEQVFTTREKVAYYCAGVHRTLRCDDLSRYNTDQLLAQVMSEPRAWVVFYRERSEHFCPGLRERIRDLARSGSKFTLERTFVERYAHTSRHLEVYLWQRSPAGG